MELLKITYLLPDTKNVFNFLNEVWNKKRIPKYWDMSCINAQDKQKGRHQEPHTYRGITVESIMVKVLMNIILTKLSLCYESQLLTTQFGFRSG